MYPIAIVVSRFNEGVTEGLLRGAQEYLNEQGISVAESQIFHAPGAFEIPLIAQKLAKTGRFSGIIGLGCVIKGDTAHFEFISLAAAMGTLQAMLSTEVPISFGILTTYAELQAFERSANNSHNKGREAAAACLDTIRILERISSLPRDGKSV